MTASLHHAHIFARDIAATITWWREMLGGEVVYDGDFGGTRNVFMRVGEGRLHIYDQPPRDEGRGAVHHLGIHCDDLPALMAAMTAKGAAFRGGIREFGQWRYIMCAAPDNVLLELFQADADLAPPALAAYFMAVE
ncbi:MAG: VOC family protein [Alphaproteobacteria bacterium]|jgi:catechol 2,3-dioxygenase-like lactoylglutathione lyase family enzyme|nr:VOC family protein [Alphaproteobacteria bacterium]MDP6567058.1 VOC family protein [Alphaproteobacteria bacterium]MDP6812478.1 VOC family protein [Alphaproteobacteria bacterium]